MQIEFAPGADRQLRTLTDQVQRRIIIAIAALANDPRPHGWEKLSGEESLYRIRIGDYRVIYQVSDEKLLVLIVRVGHRRDIYR